MSLESFSCFMVRKVGKDQIETGIETRPLIDLPAGDVLIRVAYSSLNYKDALAVSGHPGIVRQFPHVPGIDAAGTVVESGSQDFQSGQRVLVTGYEFGSERWGGWSELVRVPAEWVVPLPDGLTLQQSMIHGTAGFTAAMSVEALAHHGIAPESGEVLVTGATGGVGILAVKLLAALGYTVVAVSGKPEKYAWLEQHGAARVVSRDEVSDQSGKPLLPSHWAGAIDTVGGNTLSTLLRSTKIEGCVAACGLVGGVDLSLTVYPFILRGVTLAGIDSAWCPRERRLQIWSKLAGQWKLDDLDAIATTTDLSQVGEHAQRMLSGKTTGRIVVRLPND